MAWVFLFVAGVLEVIWAYTMTLSSGFTKIVPSLITLITMAMSFFFLSTSLKSILLGTAYATWTGIGIVGAFIIGIVAFGEPCTGIRIFAVSLIICGLTLLRLFP